MCEFVYMCGSISALSREQIQKAFHPLNNSTSLDTLDNIHREVRQCADERVTAAADVQVNVLISLHTEMKITSLLCSVPPVWPSFCVWRLGSLCPASLCPSLPESPPEKQKQTLFTLPLTFTISKWSYTMPSWNNQSIIYGALVIITNVGETDNFFS